MKTFLQSLKPAFFVNLSVSFLLILSIYAVSNLYISTYKDLDSRSRVPVEGKTKALVQDLRNLHLQDIVLAEGEKMDIDAVILTQGGKATNVKAVLNDERKRILFYCPAEQAYQWSQTFSRCRALNKDKFLFLISSDKIQGRQVPSIGGLKFYVVKNFDSLVLNKENSDLAFFCLLSSDGTLHKIFVPYKDDERIEERLGQLSAFL